MSTDGEARWRETSAALREAMRTGQTKTAAELVAGAAKLATEAARSAQETGCDYPSTASRLARNAATGLAVELAEEAQMAAELLAAYLSKDVTDEDAKRLEGASLSDRLLDLSGRFPHRSGMYTVLKEAALCAAREEGAKRAELAAARMRVEVRAKLAAGRIAGDPIDGGA